MLAPCPRLAPPGIQVVSSEFTSPASRPASLETGDRSGYRRRSTDRSGENLIGSVDLLSPPLGKILDLRTRLGDYVWVVLFDKRSERRLDFIKSGAVGNSKNFVGIKTRGRCRWRSILCMSLLIVPPGIGVSVVGTRLTSICLVSAVSSGIILFRLLAPSFVRPSVRFAPPRIPYCDRQQQDPTNNQDDTQELGP